MPSPRTAKQHFLLRAKLNSSYPELTRYFMAISCPGFSLWIPVWERWEAYVTLQALNTFSIVSYTMWHPHTREFSGLTKLVAHSPQAHLLISASQALRDCEQVTWLKSNATKTLLWRENSIHFQWSRSEKNPGGSLEVQRWCLCSACRGRAGVWVSLIPTNPHGESFTLRAFNTLWQQRKNLKVTTTC